VSDLIDKIYNPENVEDKWYKVWNENGYFNPDTQEGNGDNYCIVIPPPNVTGVLHTGHALNTVLHDILVRYNRMNQKKSLWLPGTDHAGIATQNVVEKALLKNENKHKEDLGREKFVETVWDWKEKTGTTILDQLKKMGASTDWTRERFTLDEGLSKAVRTVFVRLYKEGLIEKENYLINWCPRCQTAISDIEVNHVDKASHMWHIKYPIVDPEPDGPQFLVVATTRPETMLGDTAVAFSPDDERYLKLKGKKVLLPLVNREIELIYDSYVDKEFGTGAVKVTPAHDPNDFMMGRRHNLEELNILTSTGIINKNGGVYEGLDRTEARIKIVEDLKEQGFLVKIEDHEHAVGHCYRCETIVEPWLSEQWFVRMKKLAEPAIKAVKEGQVQFVPDKWEKVYFEWMNNIRDWCISRQIWWGHRIPVFYCQDCEHVNVEIEDPTKCAKCGSENLRQDEDVLDTWFSSALWPFSTLGWPDTEAKDLHDFYPNSLLITGFDIIYFWVARMIIMGIKFMGDVPFNKVYITQLIRDEHGKKMSKSLGNIINPLDVIDEYGCDSLRFTLSSLAIQTSDIQLGMKSFEVYRNFINKFWNTARFTLMNLEGFVPSTENIKELELELPDKYILSRLNSAVTDVRKNLDNFSFPAASKSVYEFLWSEFADWYIETAKTRLYSDDEKRKNVVQHVLYFVLKEIVKLKHPFCPFVTEEVWEKLVQGREKNPKHLIITEYPTVEKLISLAGDHGNSEMQFKALAEIITNTRQIRSESNIPPATKIEVFVNTKNTELCTIIEENSEWINFLTKSSAIITGANLEKPEGSAVSSIILDWDVEMDLKKVDLFIPITKYVDLDKERERIEKEIKKAEIELKRTSGKLSSDKFVKRAPADIVEKEREKHRKYEELCKKLKSSLDSLK